jgi:chromosome segregation ATPase
MRILDERRDSTLRIATRDGLLVTGAGALCGGSERDRDVQLLGRRQRRIELQEEMDVVQGELDAVIHSLAGLEADLAAARDERLRLEAALRAEEAQHHDLALSRATLETLLAEASARRAQAGALHATLQAEIASQAARLPELASSAEALGREGEDQGRALADRERAFADLDREREQLRHEWASCGWRS